MRSPVHLLQQRLDQFVKTLQPNANTGHQPFVETPPGGSCERVWGAAFARGFPLKGRSQKCAASSR
jgi:hypothetical protein